MTGRFDSGAAAAPRVLIFSADVGEGHVAAARALQEALLKRGVQVEHEDGLRCLGAVVRWLIRDGYRGQLRTASWTYNVLYQFWRLAGPARWIGARVLYLVGRWRLARVIAARRPEIVVSTHPALTAALGRMRRRHELDAILCATITDLTTNPMWSDRGADLHVVMHPIAIPWVERRAGRGSAAASAPLVSARFRTRLDTAGARTALGLPVDATLIVISGGGWGVGMLADGVEAALAGGAGHVVVLAGRNTRAREDLAERFGQDGRVTVLGFTDRMPELLSAATALVHGTGGVTSLEAIACGCPVIAWGTKLAHAREHNRALSSLGLCVVAHGAAQLQTEIAHRIAAVGQAAQLLTGGHPPTVAAGASGAARDAADVVLCARARVRPVPRWVLHARRSSVTVAATVATMWTGTAAAAPAAACPLAPRAAQPAMVAASAARPAAPSSSIAATAVEPRVRPTTAARTSARPRPMSSPLASP